MTKTSIPKEIIEIAKKLEKADFDAYLVGGCVRDVLLGRDPKDWDITTSAKPEQIQKLFPDSVYENNFGTVGVKTRSKNETLKIVEITTFRKDISYSDGRHPDKIVFAKTVEEDLARRDFTVNAMALSLKSKLVDIFGGQIDLSNKLIKAVGSPDDRFGEDALRMLRAVRFSAQLDFQIEQKTLDSIIKNSHLLKNISKERIRDEFQKMIMTPRAAWAVQILSNLKLLKFIIPELEEGINVGQNKHHIYTVWEHNLRALDYAVSKNYSLEIRLGSLLHDVGKPRSKSGDGPNSTFYQHEYIGATMTKKILENLKFPKDVINDVTLLVRCHLFYYNVGEVSAAGVRRFISRVGEEYIDDILKIREADRIGSGVPKAFPYRLRHLKFMIEKVKHDPVSPKNLKINGNDLIKKLSLKPGPRIGHILNSLLEEIIEDPKKNIKSNLEKRAKALNKLSDKELLKLREKAEKVKEEFETGIEAEMKKKHKV
ncbi:MAG: HD domain-containing protein [Candidatus Paceibacterota bacterium]|jgi:poly(A) polymerase/tRNA nucleotidyltransferase (CCA-adding enzyme)